MGKSKCLKGPIKMMITKSRNLYDGDGNDIFRIDVLNANHDVSDFYLRMGLL